ncbi:MAG: NUDIX hydrolase [Armatimonadota bacterium]
MSGWEQLRAEWAGRQMQFVPSEPPPSAKRRYVVVLISDESGHRFLIAQIAGRGYCTPSGHIEPHEQPEEAAHREAYEEAGALVEDLELLGYYRLLPCSADEPEECVAPVFLARLVQLEPLPCGSESQGVRWATLEEMPALYYQWSPLLEAVFRYASERRREARAQRTG